ncbi:MAG: cation:proton antiporter [Polyangiales bacterium]
MNGASNSNIKKAGRVLPQLFIIALLVMATIGLHSMSRVTDAGVDPTSMLALGFVIIVCYAIGNLAEAVNLPHITGYLLSGLLLGPSIADLIVKAMPYGYYVPAPFDRGILNYEVIDQLSLLDTLAVALIALTAGGEVQLESLKKGLREILAILAGQYVTIMVGITAFFVAVSGAVGPVAIPGLGELGLAQAIALGSVVAAIAYATSPAATVAVITETKATGPMARTVLSSVVLKDVVVIITFAVVMAYAGTYFGESTTNVGLGAYLLTHVGMSIVAGVLVGALMGLYTRYVGTQLLLFLVGIVFTTTFVAKGLHWDPVLIFIAAGFTVSNFSKSGDKTIHSVEVLSLPVYVVFFTLAGARLHLDQLAHLAPFAIGLVLARVAMIWTGVRAASLISNPDEATKSYGWLGFVSQAGVAIVLAGQVGDSFGEIGGTLETFVIGGVALNELFGPIMLKIGLGLAGETSSSGPRLSDPNLVSVRPPPTVVPEEGTAEILAPWPQNIGNEDLWGEPLHSKSEVLNARTDELGTDLQNIVRDVSTGPLRAYRVDAEKYLRDLRREFLRHHRRISVQARSDDPNRFGANTLRNVQSELAANWRGIVLGRSITSKKEQWTPESLISSLDRVVDALPKAVEAPYEDISYEFRSDESIAQAVERTWLRAKRGLRKPFRQSPPTRVVPMNSLGRYHIFGKVPPKLESLAALFVEADRHLAARTRSLFDGIAHGYDRIASHLHDKDFDIDAEIALLRSDFEEEMALALEEVRRIARDGTNRTASALASAYSAIKKDLPTFATFDLPESRRRSSKVFANRVRAIDSLTNQLNNLRKASGAGYSTLAMELELLGLEAKIKEAVEEHAHRLQNMVQRRAIDQIERVDDALKEALTVVQSELSNEKKTGEELSESLRDVTESTTKVAGEAARVTTQLRADLSDETKIAPLLDALMEACRTLTPRYRLIVGQPTTGEWKLPSSLPEIDIPFREVVLTYVESRAAPKLLLATRNLAHAVSPLAGTLQELERLIAFNVELATAELEIVHDEPVPEEMHDLLEEMIPGQLERSVVSLDDYKEKSRQWQCDLNEQMQDAVLGTIRDLRHDLAEGSFSRTRLEAMRRAASGRASLVGRESLPSRIVLLRGQLLNSIRSIVGEERVEIWRQRFGVGAATSPDQLAVGEFTAKTVSQEIPLVYRRLFAADTMEAGDVLTGRQEEIRLAESVLSSNDRQRLRSIAIVGRDGVGKAAVSTAIVRGGRWKNIKRVEFEKPVTVQEVRDLFSEAPEGQLVVLSGLPWLISMAPGGFEPMREFVSGIIREGGRRRWIAYANDLFWNFASTVAPLRDAFPEVIRLEPLDAEALQAAVIARHRLSGYGHSFDRREGDSALERFVARVSSRIRRPYDQYFQELHLATGGLVRDALRLWLASIRDIQEGDIVRLGPVPPSDYARLNRLPDDILVNLYQIARQGWMDAAGQARIFRIDESTAQAQLARLAHVGLLMEHEGDFEIAIHLRGSLGRIFEERGWIL